ncbi:vitamin K epoxide reductase family protein [Terrabacter sp. NPDC000476]|uniref:vitamin K epoxide reductase family protein n=1 Tax=Terrabacter sp. NPDC000476 TaxID=3154258 RepID=UPI0033317963
MTVPADAIPFRRRGGGLAWVLTSAGMLGLLAAATLLVEKIALLRDSTYVPSCSINPVLSCGSVMTSPQAEAFGVPNPLLGVVGFTVVTTTGVALLAGARLPRWFWLGLQIGVTAGVGFVHWLIAQSLYVIGALCPYCILVWVVTITLFVGVTARNLAAGLRTRSAALRHLPRWAPTVGLGWLAVIAALIGVRFWDYWSLQLRAGHSPLVWLAAGAGLYVLILAAAVMQSRFARSGPG